MSSDRVAFNMKSTLVSVEAMPRYLLVEEKLKNYVKLTTLKDD